MSVFHRISRLYFLLLSSNGRVTDSVISFIIVLYLPIPIVNKFTCTRVGDFD